MVGTQAVGRAREIVLGVSIGAVIGLVTALIAGGFVRGVGWIARLSDASLTLGGTIGGHFVSARFGVTLLVAALLLLVVRRAFGIARWNGPADSIYAAHRADNELDLRAGFGSTLAAFISASGGASVGQYGPLVHFGATMGAAIQRWTGARISADVFIGCGVSAAISAGFDAPLAGIIFAHEAVLRHFSLRALAPISISAILAAAAMKYLFPSVHLLTLSEAAPPLHGLIVPLVLAGVLFGMMAIGFMTLLRASARFNQTLGLRPWQSLMVATVLAGMIGAVFPDAMGLGTQVVAQIFQGSWAAEGLFVLVLAKLLVTALCLGFGFFGGVFSPALLIGAASGAILGQAMVALGVTVPGPAMALAGMAAVAAAVVGAPLATVVIVLELTASYEFALLALVAVVVSMVVSSLFFGQSYFDRQLLDRKIDVSRGRGHLRMMQEPVTDHAHDGYLTLRMGDSVTGALAQMRRAHVTEAYCTDADGRLRGKVALLALLAQSGDGLLDHVIEIAPLQIKSDASLLQAIEQASGFVGESIPVVDTETGRLVGIVTEADLFSAYLALETRIRDLEKL
ncbi:MAG: chloride channel protein [Paracoccaceae bacterium]|nr:chloride channel protein [Paracoccaceae bacterium]